MKVEGTVDPVRRKLLIMSAALPLMPVAGTASAAAVAKPRHMPTGGIGDFDFQEGRWRVQHRSRSASSDSWREFQGECSMRKTLGGQGNVEDHMWQHSGQTYRAMGLRTFDPAQRTWSIFWIDSRWPTTIGSAVVGGFDGSRGTFYSDSEVNGRPLRSRFVWTVDGPNACRWEQASSSDGEQTWDTNWYMSFARIL